MSLQAGMNNYEVDFTSALLDTEQPCPANLSAWNGSDPVKRFAVYRNNVVSSLIDALEDTFPVTRELVGDEFFRAMARIFITRVPPKSPVLAEYGDEFPEFIANFSPVQSVPYLADVARLEMFYLTAYHAADATPLDEASFRGALSNADALPSARLQLHPSASVLRSTYAAGSLWAAHQGTIDLATVDPYLAEEILIIRPFWEVLVVPLRPGAGRFIELLANGASFGESALAVSVAFPDFDLTTTLADIIRTGAVVAFNFNKAL